MACEMTNSVSFPLPVAMTTDAASMEIVNRYRNTP